jgi:hypothetical protein
MKVNIIGQALFQILTLLFFWFFGWGILGSTYLPEEAMMHENDDDDVFKNFPTGAVMVNYVT